VQRFIEKPPLPKARAFLAEGGYYWNSGIFLFRRDAIWQALAQHLPELHQGLSRLLAGEPRPSLAEVYDALPGISLDHGIMEKAQRVAVVPVDMGWNDVGTWEALHEIFPPDAHGNVMLGKKTLDMGSRDSLIYAHDRLVATIGLDRLMVVDTPDATLVCHRDRVQEVKDLVAELARQNMVESIYHPTVERPWGRYTVMDEGWSYKVKRIEVDPGKRLSLQMHRQRAEHWVAVAGAALVTLGEQIRPLTANQSIYIPPQTAHRLENPHAEPFMLIEVQTGAYLGEDDIIRLEHDYWQPEEV
jgi:mannose-1-phosphate guanylyltransferase/mannose-6-phosphate isomerase